MLQSRIERLIGEKQRFLTVIAEVDKFLKRLTESDLDALPEDTSARLKELLHAHFHPVNCIAPLSFYASSPHPLIAPILSGPRLVNDRKEAKKANVKAFLDHHKKYPFAFALLVDRVEPGKPYEKSFRDIVDAMKDTLTHARMDAVDPRRRDEHLAKESHEIFWDALPKTMRYIATDAQTHHPAIDDAVFDLLIENLPLQTELEEIYWLQCLSSEQLKRLLDALPKSVRSLSVSMPVSMHSDRPGFLDDHIELFATHPAIAQLERLYIARASATHHAKLDALESLQSLDHYSLQAPPYATRDISPLYMPWENAKEDQRKKLLAPSPATSAPSAESLEDTPPIPLDADKIVLDSRTIQTVDVIRNILYERRDPSKPRRYPNVKTLSLWNMEHAALRDLIQDGGRCFPAAERLNLSFVEAHDHPTLEAFSHAPTPWSSLCYLHIDLSHQAGASILDLLWKALTTLDDPAIFPNLEECAYPLWPDHALSFLTHYGEFMPSLGHLIINPIMKGSFNERDRFMVDTFQHVLATRAWEHTKRLSLFLAPSMPNLGKDRPEIKFWLEQAQNEDLPANLRRHILRMLFGIDSVKRKMYVNKDTMRKLYGPAFGVKLTTSLSADAMVDRIIKSLPLSVQNYQQI